MTITVSRTITEADGANVQDFASVDLHEELLIDGEDRCLTIANISATLFKNLPKPAQP